MKRWTVFLLAGIALFFGAFGCGSSGTQVTITVSPAAASVVLNTSEQFGALVDGNTNQTVTWTVTCASGVTNCGSIVSTSGLYTAPGALPSTPTATITATSQADTSKTATATVTIISGISVSIAPTTATIGTNEQYTFTADVTNPGCTSSTNSTCFNVEWAISGTSTSTGSINANGTYTAPSAVPSPATVTITATAVQDTSVVASSTISIVAATDPTISAVSPNNIGQGSAFGEVFIAGTQFLATTVVYVNGVPLPAANVDNVSGSGLIATVGAQTLAAPPSSGILQVTVSRQNGTQQSCTPDVTSCQIVVVPTRPALIGTTPDSVPQTFGGSLNFDVNGGFFGTTQTPAVTATFDGQVRSSSVITAGDLCATAANPCTGRQLSVLIGGSNNASDLATPGLHQVTINSATNPAQYEATNLAVQPNIGSNPPSPGSPIAVGTTPVDVAVDDSLGLAVVANNGSNNVTFVDMTQSPPAVIGSLCTGAVGQQTSSCPASGPVTVAAGRLGTGALAATDIALVANSTAKNVAVINLNTRSVITLIALQDIPAGVGFNPVTARGLVTLNTKGYGVLLDLTQASPVTAGVVTITTGPNSHVAVEPDLNWALATPGGGGVGTLSIVNLSQQTLNNIVSVSRTLGIVTVNVQPTNPSIPQLPLTVRIGDAVLIQGIADTTFDGIFSVTNVGSGTLNCTSGISCFAFSQVAGTGTSAVTPPDVPLENVTGTANYSQPVATASLATSIQGISINKENKQALLTDPTTSGSVTFFSLLDQSVNSITIEPGYIAGAFNSLTDLALVVNESNNQLSVINPAASPAPARVPTSTSTYATGNHPMAIAIDEASNQAIVANQNDNTVWVYGLGSIRPLSITDLSPTSVVLISSLSSGAPASSNLTLTITGAGFTSSSVPRLDGVAVPVQSVSGNGRVLVATVPGSMLNQAHNYTVDVQSAGVVSNVENLGVIQSIDVSIGTGCTTAPLPTGVAVDSQRGLSGLAVVTLYGCNTVAVIDIASGTGTIVPVGTNPQGVALLPNIHSAIIANNGSAAATVIDYLAGQTTDIVSVGNGPAGVAVDPATDEAAVTNNVDNTVSIVAVSPGTSAVSNTISTGQSPLGVAFDYANHQIAVGSLGGSGSVNIGDAAGTSLSTSFSETLPTTILYDPAANTFLVNESGQNQVSILSPSSTTATGTFSVGINPTDMAYNYLTSTLVTTNTASRTLTVMDFLDAATNTTCAQEEAGTTASNIGCDREVRAVLTLPPPPPTSLLTLSGSLQFGVDLSPLTNVAVVADTANGKVLIMPLPH